MGAALVRTGEFLKAVPSATSYWGNTSQDAPLHPGSHLPFSRYYPVVEPPVVCTQEQLRGALLQMGAALVRTGEFLKAVPSATSLPQQAITRSSRATTTGEVSMPSLEQIWSRSAIPTTLPGLRS